MDLMDVEELAAYLKLKPVTVYKYLRRGVLPGFKVGGAWRFRKTTIDQWILRQEKQMIGEAVEEDDAHGKDDLTGSGDCSLCSKPMLEKHSGGMCEEEGCQVPICRRCWKILGRRRCLKHRSSSPTAPAKAEAGPVDGKMARFQETKFLERFELNLREIKNLESPDGRLVSVKSLIGKKTASDQRISLLRHPACRMNSRELEARFPLNRSLSFDLKSPIDKIFGKMTPAALETRVCFRLEEMLTGGGQERPIDETEAVSAIGSVLDQSKRDGVMRVVGFYSPQGWTVEALELISPGNKGSLKSSFATGLVSFLFIGPEITDLHYDLNDARASFFAPLFAGELPEETRIRCVKVLRAHLVGLRHLTQAEAVEILGVNPAIAREALNQFVKEDEDFVIKDIPNVGRTLMRRS